MVYHQMRVNECKLFNRCYVSLVREKYNLKESGHKSSHNSIHSLTRGAG
jgi:hypothetical protein